LKLLRNTILLFCCLFFFACKKDNTNLPINDSDKKIKSLFKDAGNTNLKVEQKKIYYDSIINYISKRKNDSITRDYYFQLASEYYRQNDFDNSKTISRIAHRLSVEGKDTLAVAKALYYIGDCYEPTKKDSAFYYYLQAEKIYSKKKDYENLGRMYLYKGGILYNEGNYTESEIEVSNALHFLTPTKNHRLIYGCYNMLAINLQGLNYDSEALKYHELALKEFEKLKLEETDPRIIISYSAPTLNNMGYLYEKMGEHNKAIEQFEKVIAIKDLRKISPDSYATSLSNLAYSRMKTGNFSNLPDMFFEALHIRDSLDIKSAVVFSKIQLGEYYLMKKDTAKSISIFKESYQLANDIKSYYEILRSLKLLSQIDNQNNLHYSNVYIAVSDSLQKKERATRNKYARIAYETERLEEENQVLTKRNLYILIGAAFFIFLVTALGIIRHLKAKNKELQLLQQQQEANEEIYHLLIEQQEKVSVAKEEEKSRIAMELHDNIMNKIYGVRMNLGFFNNKADEKATEKRKEYILELQNIEKEIRTISHDLKKNSFFEERNFSELLSFLIKSQENINSTSFHHEIDESINWDTVPSTTKINIYRIIQEAILNINKYANAKNAFITITPIEENTLKLVVSDDGKGFDLKSSKKGIGLKNMTERITALRGELKIKSNVGKGTQIEAVFSI